MKHATAPANVRIWVYRLVLIVLGLIVGLLVAEVGLRLRTAQIAGSDAMSPVLVQPHPTLGWVLTPGWQGTHRHHDFQARYQVNPNGFRADVAVPEVFSGRKIYLVGDSFTFGLGVNDDQTFAHLLTKKTLPKTAFINAAVPGYSTDQEVLLIENELLAKKPDEIIMIVYLANDLLDNLRPVPLQVRAPKPFFKLADDELVLQSGAPNPTPMAEPPAGGDFLQAVLGNDIYQRSWRRRWEKRSELFRLASLHMIPESAHTEEYERNLQPALGLFEALIERVILNCHREGVKFSLALLPGRSLITNPKSLSAQYQDFLRNKIIAMSRKKELRIMDLSRDLNLHEKPGSLFYAADGHLTPEGHRVVAEALARESRE